MKSPVSNKADALNKLGKKIETLPINKKPYAHEENKLKNIMTANKMKSQ